jgi:thiamine biosynthesis lipoprotein ApbE
MKIKFFLLASILLAGFCRANPPGSTPSYVSHYENVLGTSMELKIFTVSEPDAKMAENAVFHEITRLSAILSGYDPNSEFSRWMRTFNTPVAVSPELFEVLGLFDQWRARTGGALDPAAEVVTRLWKQAASKGRLPSSEELAQAVVSVRRQHWKLDSVTRTATHLSDAPLMLNSFTKSFIIRHAADAGRSAGQVGAIIVNIGGDLVISGSAGETVLISDPKDDAENAEPIDRLYLSNRAVATSGNYRRGEEIGGRWYSHIVDPRTGQPAGQILSATVVARDASDAGALATAFNVLSPAESIQLARTIPGADYLIITADGQRVSSPGWKSLEVSQPGRAVHTQPETAGFGQPGRAVPSADGEFELLIDLQINLQNGGNIKRPYVAIWIENEDHAPVRTISVWHGSDRYMPELKSWYLKYRDRYTTDQNFNSSSTSATRSAGKYTLKWDGKDDEGKPVKPGKYVLKIEASREHGTYQLMRQEIDWNNTPKQVNIGSNMEVSASMDYRKVTNGN